MYCVQFKNDSLSCMIFFRTNRTKPKETVSSSLSPSPVIFPLPLWSLEGSLKDLSMDRSFSLYISFLLDTYYGDRVLIFIVMLLTPRFTSIPNHFRIHPSLT